MTDAKETARKTRADEGKKWDAMPERIWTCNETTNIWINEKQSKTTEYARADLLTKAQADLDAANAEVARLRTPAGMTDVLIPMLSKLHDQHTRSQGWNLLDYASKYKVAADVVAALATEAKP